MANPAVSRRRGRALRALAVLFSLMLWYVPGLGLVDLLSALLPDPEGGTNRVLSAGYGATVGLLIPAGFLAQLHTPARRIAGLQQVAVVALTCAVAGLVGTAWNWLVFAAVVGVLLGVLLRLHPDGLGFVARGAGVSRPLAGLAAVAAAPWLAYAWRMAANQRADLPPADAESVGLRHWAALSALSLAVVLLALLAAIRTRGWQVPAWSAALAATVWGVASWIDPNAPASGGRGWGALAIAWGLALAATAAWETRRGHSAVGPAGG